MKSLKEQANFSDPAAVNAFQMPKPKDIIPKTEVVTVTRKHFDIQLPKITYKSTLNPLKLAKVDLARVNIPDRYFPSNSLAKITNPKLPKRSLTTETRESRLFSTWDQLHYGKHIWFKEKGVDDVYYGLKKQAGRYKINVVTLGRWEMSSGYSLSSWLNQGNKLPDPNSIRIIGDDSIVIEKALADFATTTKTTSIELARYNRMLQQDDTERANRLQEIKSNKSIGVWGTVWGWVNGK